MSDTEQAADDEMSEFGTSGDPDRTRLAGRHAGPMAVRLAAYAREAAERTANPSMRAAWEQLAQHWAREAYEQESAT
jgi:hypothetical protein